MSEITLNVPDIHCGHCKSSIENAVAPLDGVEHAEVIIDSRTVDIAFDGSDATKTAIVAAIEDQGYAVADA